VYTSAVLNPENAAYSQNDYLNGPGQLTVSLNTIGRYVRVTRDNTNTKNGFISLALVEFLVFPPLAQCSTF
jgi:hypothetical protein